MTNPSEADRIKFPSDADRIKLAEAMDKMPITYPNNKIDLLLASQHSEEAMTMLLSLIPDPFTDANDDYAVLEWARNQCIKEVGRSKNGRPKWTSSDRWWLFFVYFEQPHNTDYQIGDYARAALKVLK